MKNKVNKYEKLTADIKAAMEYAAPMLDTEDGGTSNIDTPMIFLPRWNHESVEDAVRSAGAYAVRSEYWKAWTIVVPAFVQGNARTRHSEAIVSYLEKAGYSVCVHNTID